MAGAILLSEDQGVTFNSLTFDYITEKIRAQFGDGEWHVRDEIYRPVDEGGMSFISLIGLDRPSFTAFVRAASTAYDCELTVHPMSAYKSIWEELLTAVRADVRAAELVRH